MADSIQFDEEQNLGSRGGALAWGEYVVTRLLLGGTSRLPYFLQDGLGRILARIAMRFDTRHSQAARAYITQALGAEAARDDRLILGAYRHLFRMSIDSDAFNRKVPQSGLLRHFEIDACPEVLELLGSPGGGIMVTPHVGDWEAGAAVMPHIGMSPTYVVARPPKNRYLSRHLLRIREKKRLTVVPRRGGMRQIGAILESGGWLAMLLDQRPSGKHAVAPFFGKLARCERSAAVLIKRLGVPIVFGACYMTERPFHYRVVFPVTYTAEQLSALSVDELVALVNREQEALILRHPEQYFWLHDRYRDAPEPPAGDSASSSSEPRAASTEEGEHEPSHVNSGR